MAALAVTGSRSIQDPRVVAYALVQTLYDLGGIIELHHGDAVGVDRLAGDWARTQGIAVILHPPVAGRYFERDRALVDAADHVVAIWDGESRGTKYTLDYAHSKGKLRTVWRLAEIREELGLDIPQ